MTSDPRIQERLRRAADPLPVDVEARLEGARRRAGRRQAERRIGAGLMAVAIGAAAVAALWSLRAGDDPQPAVPSAAGTILHVVVGREWLDAELFALPVGDEPPGTLVPWPGGETPLALPSYTPDGSQVAFLIDTGERTERAPLFDVAVRRGSGPVEILARDVDIVAAPEMGPGGEVAFVRARSDRDNELVIAAPDGTIGEPVATGFAMNTLAWSPDGATIAVNGGVRLADGSIAGTPIALMSPDGSNVRDVVLDLDRYPSQGPVTFDWSADGSTLVYTSYAEDGASDLYLLDAATGDAVLLEPQGSPAGSSARYPIWAPEGDRLLFASDRDADPSQLPNATGEAEEGFGLYVMRSDGSDVRTVIPPAEGAPTPIPVDWLPPEAQEPPSPTAAGSTPTSPPAAAAPGWLLWQIEGAPGPEGTGLPFVYAGPLDGSERPAEVEDPAFLYSPDGTQMLWEEYRGDRQSDLVVGGTDRSSPVVVGTVDTMSLWGMDWSPDGSTVAYVETVDAVGELHVVDVATGEGSVISRPGLFWVAWSPDGARLAVAVRASEGSSPGVFTMDPDGGDEVRLTTREATVVVWSRAGKPIVFTSAPPEEDAGYGLWSIAPDGSDERWLGEGDWPLFSPDGARLAYTAPDPGSAEADALAVYVMRADGTDVRKVVADPGEGWPIPWAWVERWPL